MTAISGNVVMRDCDPIVHDGITLRGLEVWPTEETHEGGLWDDLHLHMEVWCIRMFGGIDSHVWSMDWVGRFYFANERDRMLFKLTWA